MILSEHRLLYFITLLSIFCTDGTDGYGHWETGMVTGVYGDCTCFFSRPIMNISGGADMDGLSASACGGIMVQDGDEWMAGNGSVAQWM